MRLSIQLLVLAALSLMIAGLSWSSFRPEQETSAPTDESTAHPLELAHCAGAQLDLSSTVERASHSFRSPKDHLSSGDDQLERLRKTPDSVKQSRESLLSALLPRRRARRVTRWGPL